MVLLASPESSSDRQGLKPVGRRSYSPVRRQLNSGGPTPENTTSVSYPCARTALSTNGGSSIGSLTRPGSMSTGATGGPQRGSAERGEGTGEVGETQRAGDGPYPPRTRTSAIEIHSSYVSYPGQHGRVAGREGWVMPRVVSGEEVKGGESPKGRGGREIPSQPQSPRSDSWTESRKGRGQEETPVLPTNIDSSPRPPPQDPSPGV